MHEVPQIILEQLGGKRFLAMTGAKNLLGSQDSLSFMLPGTPGYVKDGINKIAVILDASDTYTMKCWRIRGGQAMLKAEETDVYWDDLQAVFTRVTGLATRL